MTSAISSSSTNALSLTQAAQQAAMANLASASTASSASGTASASSQTGTAALQSLASNFNSFLSLLMSQLKNQDPTQPMDTNQFTQELVQFTGVQQSVATNSNLSTLISLTQGSEVLQSANMVGDKVSVTAPEISLQNSTGSISFSAASAGPVQIAIVNSAGQDVLDTTLNAQTGSNSWTWNGQDNSGDQMPDGAYGIAVESASGNTPAPLSFTMLGTATGLQNTASGLMLDVGAVQVPIADVQSAQK